MIGPLISNFECLSGVNLSGYYKNYWILLLENEAKPFPAKILCFVILRDLEFTCGVLLAGVGSERGPR